MKYKFKFIDLFSGIGGFHVGLASIGGKCVMASDIDPVANESYKNNFKVEPRGDIADISSCSIPAFDILCAGFPCQSFSHIGPKGGLSDPRGAIVDHVFRILKDKQPKAFILENVKGLVSHDSGDTLQYIVMNLKRAGYNVDCSVLEAKDFDLPQIRKRLFMVGILKRYKSKFVFPNNLKPTKTLSDVLGGKTERTYAFTIRCGGRRSGIDNKFNWDCYLVNGEERYIKVQECLDLQGFPRNHYLGGNTEKQYRLIGNSVPTTIVREIGKRLVDTGIFG